MMFRTAPQLICGLLLVAACGAAPDSPAIAADHQEPRTITVNGEGRASAAPDLAIINLGVVSQAETATAAMAANNKKMAAVIAAVKKQKVEPRDIQTQGLSLNPQYQRYSGSVQRNESPKIIGYNANNGVTVRLRNIDGVGEVIDAALGAGANNLNGVSFSFAEPKPLMDKARAQAVKDAQAKASLMASAAGVDLGSVLTINESGGGQVQFARTARMEMDSVGATPIEIGESTLSARVTMVFEIK